MIKESVLNPQQAAYRQVVRAGDYWMQTMNTRQTLRMVELEGTQAPESCFYHANAPAERYTAMDTIREQGNVYLTTGTQLRSNDHRVMLEIVADTCGRHD